MNKLILSTLLLVSLSVCDMTAQKTEQSGSESYGNTLNIGLGIGYYGYIGHTLPVVSLNYEFNVARNFTLAPFVTVFSYQSRYYWGSPNHPYKDYSYRHTVIPVGVKGSYYFDEILHAGSRWDFYLAASLGFTIRKTVWEDGYYGDTHAHSSTSALYLDGHVGAEYHINDNIGLYLDLSSGISTVGLAFHL